MTDNKGTAYERKIFDLCKESGSIYPDTSYAGGGAGADVTLKHNQQRLPIECKSPGADWGQKSFRMIADADRWVWNKPDEVTEIYDAMNVFDEIDPNFIPQNRRPEGMPSSDWLEEKKNIIGFEERRHDQQTIDEPNIPLSLTAMERYYNQKGVYYLQLKKFGFFHLGEDIHNLNTPAFDGEVTLRLRAKSKNNFDRRIKVVNSMGTTLSNRGSIALGKIKDSLSDGIDQENFDSSVFDVHTHEGNISINSFEEILNLIKKTTGQKMLLQGAFYKIIKYLNNGTTFAYEARPQPWAYTFFAAIKLSETRDKSPTQSPWSLEPNKIQKFPAINFSN